MLKILCNTYRMLYTNEDVDTKKISAHHFKKDGQFCSGENLNITSF